MGADCKRQRIKEKGSTAIAADPIFCAILNFNLHSLTAYCSNDSSVTASQIDGDFFDDAFHGGSRDHHV